MIFRRCHFLKLVVLAALPLLFLTAKGFSQQIPGREKGIFLADPTIYREGETFYLYGTGAGEQAGGFVVYTSKDLKSWQGPAGPSGGYALKKGEAFGESRFWAPQVFRFNNQTVMAYAADEHLGMATAPQPLGPFRQPERKAFAESVKQIDPFVMTAADGKHYLYYVVVADGGNRIWGAELNDDLKSAKLGSERLCIEATEHWENTVDAPWKVTEGPTVFYQDGWYYLLYSANDFRNIDYAVGYAVSRNPLGPWKKYGGNPIISRLVTGQNGSGHGDLFRGKSGEIYYVLHTHFSEVQVSPRRTAILQLKMSPGEAAGVDRLSVVPGSFRFLERE